MSLETSIITSDGRGVDRHELKSRDADLGAAGSWLIFCALFAPPILVLLQQMRELTGARTIHATGFGCCLFLTSPFKTQSPADSLHRRTF
jgi:hypothetical protein